MILVSYFTFNNLSNNKNIFIYTAGYYDKVRFLLFNYFINNSLV
jgi:hypothetical protein